MTGVVGDRRDPGDLAAVLLTVTCDAGGVEPTFGNHGRASPAPGGGHARLSAFVRGHKALGARPRPDAHLGGLGRSCQQDDVAIYAQDFPDLAARRA